MAQSPRIQEIMTQENVLTSIPEANQVAHAGALFEYVEEHAPDMGFQAETGQLSTASWNEGQKSYSVSYDFEADTLRMERQDGEDVEWVTLHRNQTDSGIEKLTWGATDETKRRIPISITNGPPLTLDQIRFYDDANGSHAALNTALYDKLKAEVEIRIPGIMHDFDRAMRRQVESPKKDRLKAALAGISISGTTK